MGQLTDKERKEIYVYSIFRFFPDAMLELGKVIGSGQTQHIDNNDTGEPMWDRNKSFQHMQSLTRHLVDYAKDEKKDEDGTYHLARVVWRALAQLQVDLEKDKYWESAVSHPKVQGKIHMDSIEGYDEEKAEKRMNVIGQNGNNGEHYKNKSNGKK
ncbi:MAG: DUF5664 domain-containing protein [Pirellulales bacterium]|nr:DUF5664 domain-containing protein [Pirellulales bacterium]